MADQKKEVIVKKEIDIYPILKQGMILTLNEVDGYFYLPDESDGLTKQYIENHPELFKELTPELKEVIKACEVLSKGINDNNLQSKSNTEYDYINPDHYKKWSKEVIDMMIAIWGTTKVAIHCEMCAFKYRMRLGDKPNQPAERDLEKARWYENKAKELKS